MSAQTKFDRVVKNKFFNRFINSEFAHRMIETYLGSQIKTLENPSDENILKFLYKFRTFAVALIPDRKHNQYELGLVDAITSIFEKQINGEELSDLENNRIKKTRRLIELMGTKYLKTQLISFGAINMGIGNLNRLYAPDNGPYLTFTMIQINSACNAQPRCEGCLAANDAEYLDYNTLDRIVGESVELTSRWTVIVGGEPLLEKDTLLRLFAKYKRMPFLVFTNGKLVDDDYAKEMANLGNALTLINIPGLEKTAKTMRKDPDVWNDIVNAAYALKDHGALAGFATTVYRSTYQEITSPEFVNQMLEFNMLWGLHFPYRPNFGCSPNKELLLSAEQNMTFSEKLKELNAQYPIFLIDSSKESHHIGCLAAKGKTAYIRSDGLVAACPFIPQSNSSLDIHKRSLQDILRTPYFTAVKEYNPKSPCLNSDSGLLDVIRTHHVA